MGKKLSRGDIIKALLEASFFCSAGETSLSDIANRLGIKKASLYNHFSSREDIIEQTLISSEDYLKSLTFVPPHLEQVAQRYTAETVLKGMVTRYFKMHEKNPLFQIYTFVESQKYFSKKAANIVQDEYELLARQTQNTLYALYSSQKISLPQEQIPGATAWFCSGLTNILNRYLLDRKLLLMENPAIGEGELFSLPSNDSALEKVNTLTDAFVSLLRCSK